MGANKRAARQAARNRNGLRVKSESRDSSDFAKSAVSMSVTSATNASSFENAVISKLRRNDRLSRLAVPRFAGEHLSGDDDQPGDAEAEPESCEHVG